MRRLLMLLALPPLLSGCVAVAAVGAVGTVAATGVSLGAKTVGAAGGLAVGTVSAAGHVVTGRR